MESLISSNGEDCAAFNHWKQWFWNQVLPSYLWLFQHITHSTWGIYLREWLGVATCYLSVFVSFFYPHVTVCYVLTASHGRPCVHKDKWSNSVCQELFPSFQCIFWEEKVTTRTIAKHKIKHLLWDPHEAYIIIAPKF